MAINPYTAPAPTRATLRASDYGARGDGTADDSGPIQAALDACRRGEVVVLPPGYYRCDTPLSVPLGVSLAGTWRHYATALAHTGYGSLANYGTVLVNNWAGAGSAYGSTPFVSLDSYSSLEGVAIFDATQGLPGTTQIARAFQIGTSSPSPTDTEGPDSPSIRRVTILNADKGVRMQGAFRFLLEDVFISAFGSGVDVDACYDTSRIDRCHVIPAYWCSLDTNVPAPILNHLLTHLVAYRFGRVDSVLMSQSMCFAAQTGMLFNSSAFTLSPNAPWVRVSDCDLDICDIGIDLQQVALQGVNFTGIGITTPGSAANDIGIRVGASAGSWGLANSSIQSQSGKEVRIAGGSGTISGTRLNGFNSLGGSSASIALTAGSVAVSGCEFRDARPQLANSGSGKATVVGCLTNGGLSTSNTGGGSVVTSGNN